MYRIQGNVIKWKIEHLRHDDYNIIIVDDNEANIMEIYTNDIIHIEEREYSIYLSLYQYIQRDHEYDNNKYNTMCVILHDIVTEESTEYSAQEFIDMFEKQNVTYVKSLLLDWINSNK